MCVRSLYVFDQCTLIDVRTRYRQADMNEGEAVDSKERQKRKWATGYHEERGQSVPEAEVSQQRRI